MALVTPWLFWVLVNRFWGPGSGLGWRTWDAVGERLINLVIYHVKRKLRCFPNPVLALSPIVLPAAMGSDSDEQDLVPARTKSINSSLIVRLVVKLIISITTLLLV